MNVIIKDKIFWDMCRDLKSGKYELFAVTHKGRQARFVFHDICDCPFAVDMFQVVTWDMCMWVKCETEFFWQLSKYEKSKLPDEFWAAYGAMKREQAEKREEKKEKVA